MMLARRIAPGLRSFARGNVEAHGCVRVAPFIGSTSQPTRYASSSSSSSSSPQSGKQASQRTKGMASSSAPNGKAGPSAPQPAVGVAARRKLTPAAKAKAQASASSALREQIRATIVSQKENGKEQPKAAVQAKRGIDEEASIDEVVAAIARETLQAESSSTSTQIRRLRDVVAFATAEQYDFEALIASGRLPADWQLIEDGEVIYVPHWPPLRPHQGATEKSSAPSTNTRLDLATSVHGGEAFIFRSGSYVTWGMSADQSRKFLRSVIKGRSDGTKAMLPGVEATSRQTRPVERFPYEEIGDEAMEFIMTDDQVTRTVGDIIVLGRAPRSEEEEIENKYTEEATAVGTQGEDPDWTPLLARVAFSQGLARSARLSVQEAKLSSYLEEVATVPSMLEAKGAVSMGRRQVIRKMGTLLKLRQRANLDAENFLDDPEMYWDNAQLENHYDSICVALDIESRFKAYNEKLDHGENLLGILRALLTEASTHRMELIIIYLIAFEVCIALITHDYIPTPSSILDFFFGTGSAAPSPEILASSPETASSASASQLSSQGTANHSTAPMPWRHWDRIASSSSQRLV